MRKTAIFVYGMLAAVSLWFSGFAIGGAVMAQSAAPIAAPSQPDPAFINNAILVLQQQRNKAQDEVAQAQAQLAVTQGKLDVANKELAELKAKAEPPAK